MNAAGDDMEIRVAGRVFNEVPTESTSSTVAISGGWNDGFDEQHGIQPYGLTCYLKTLKALR